MRSSWLTTLEIFGSKSKNPRAALCGVRGPKVMTLLSLFCKVVHRPEVTPHLENSCSGVSLSSLHRQHSFVSERLRWKSLLFKKKDIVQNFVLKNTSKWIDAWIAREHVYFLPIKTSKLIFLRCNRCQRLTLIFDEKFIKFLSSNED